MPEPALLDKITSCDYSFDDPVWEDISTEAREVVKDLLVLDPSKRMKVDDFLKHPWIDSAKSHNQPLPATIQRLQSFTEVRKKVCILIWIVVTA